MVEETKRPFGRRRVVVVNDDPAVLAMYRDALKDLDHDPVALAIGAVDVGRIREAAADAVILDLQVGEQVDYGVRLAQRLRADDEFVAIPIIICTGNAVALDSARVALREIDVPVVLKPIDLDRLDALLRSDGEG